MLPASGYRGVQAAQKGWTAKIRHNAINHHLGTFPTPTAAAMAYDKEAQRLHGANATLNFPNEVTPNDNA